MRERTNFRQQLGLEDNVLAVRLCSSFNFHPEENYKLEFWRGVLLGRLPSFFPSETWKFSKFTPAEIRKFWQDCVLPNAALPGLNNLLLALVSDGAFWRASDVNRATANLFSPPSLVRRLLDFAIYSVLGDRTISDSEAVIAKSPFVSLAVKIAEEVADLHGTPDVVLITESEIQERLPRHPSLAPADLTNLVFLAASESLAGVCFEVNKTRAVKISFVTGRRENINKADESKVIQRLALKKLEAMESQLERKIGAADTKCRDHLRENRKSLAMNSLKERKMYESKLFEIHALKMKIAESHSLTQTAILQQFVVDTMSASLAASKMLGVPTNAEHVVEDVNRANDKHADVTETLQPNMVFDDKELDEEFEKLRREAREANVIVLPSVPSSNLPPPSGELIRI